MRAVGRGRPNGLKYLSKIRIFSKPRRSKWKKRVCVLSLSLSLFFSLSFSLSFSLPLSLFLFLSPSLSGPPRPASERELESEEDERGSLNAFPDERSHRRRESARSPTRTMDCVVSTKQKKRRTATRLLSSRSSQKPFHQSSNHAPNSTELFPKDAANAAAFRRAATTSAP